MPPTDVPQHIAVRLALRGQVQGRGVRPAIVRLAQQLSLAGSVQNTLSGLEILAEGDNEALTEFRRGIPSMLPEGCRIDSIDEEPIEALDADGFAILCEESAGPLATQIPPDIAACPKCVCEVGESRNRRYRYPLTTCAACGPRYSIIDRMPYERPETTMAGFDMCKSCQAEYTNPADRRFHAQTIGCQDCGPGVWAVDAHGHQVERDESAVMAAVAALCKGRIVALRGVGGYQLLCDAKNHEAVQRLRLRKRRPSKPLALLVGTLDDARRLAFLSDAEADALADSANPIVLVKARDAALLAPSIHPGLDTVGIMLPTTPLHAMLAEHLGRPLVCTSANCEGEPLQYQIAESQHLLAGIADLWLHHDRPIVRPIDDSVVRVIAERPVTIRLARGFAPLPLDCRPTQPTVALGGHLKTAGAWYNGRQSVLGAHVGDMEALASRERFASFIEDSKDLYEFAPSTLVHDLHPDYFTTQYAKRQPARAWPVQHHFAHVAAGMLEHGLLDREVLGVAWDGTGFGTDGSIWGGEFLMVDSAQTFDRIAHLRPFALPGGETAVREPVRVACAVLADSLGPETVLRAKLFAGFVPTRVGQILKLTASPRLSVQTTSAGRLFDAAAAVILGITAVDFEGQAAMMLESSADRSHGGSYPIQLTSGTPAQLDWRPLFVELWSDRRAGTSPGVMAMRFHRAMAHGITLIARRHVGVPVVLCGGVFQNRLLTELVVELSAETSELMLPGKIPPNDGGLAAGQLAVASQLGKLF